MILVITQAFQVRIKLKLVILTNFIFEGDLAKPLDFSFLLQTVIRPIFQEGIWQIFDGQFEYYNGLTLSRDFIELTHVTGFIKYLYLIKMFIFINAKKVHSFLL